MHACAAALAVLVVVSVGCGGAHHASAALALPSNPAAAWSRAVHCARGHGMPRLPFPRIDASGKATFPAGLTVPARTRGACQAQFDRLAPSGQDDSPTPADMASLLRFSRCMRSHGVADWPDPRPDGTFQPDERIARSLKTVFRSQFMTCERFNPDPRGRISFSHA